MEFDSTSSKQGVTSLDLENLQSSPPHLELRVRNLEQVQIGGSKVNVEVDDVVNKLFFSLSFSIKGEMKDSLDELDFGFWEDSNIVPLKLTDANGQAKWIKVHKTIYEKSFATQSKPKNKFEERIILKSGSNKSELEPRSLTDLSPTPFEDIVEIQLQKFLIGELKKSHQDSVHQEVFSKIESFQQNLIDGQPEDIQEIDLEAIDTINEFISKLDDGYPVTQCVKKITSTLKSIEIKKEIDEVNLKIEDETASFSDFLKIKVRINILETEQMSIEFMSKLSVSIDDDWSDSIDSFVSPLPETLLPQLKGMERHTYFEDKGIKDNFEQFQVFIHEQVSVEHQYSQLNMISAMNRVIKYVEQNKESLMQLAAESGVGSIYTDKQIVPVAGLESAENFSMRALVDKTGSVFLSINIKLGQGGMKKVKYSIDVTRGEILARGVLKIDDSLDVSKEELIQKHHAIREEFSGHENIMDMRSFTVYTGKQLSLEAQMASLSSNVDSNGSRSSSSSDSVELEDGDYHPLQLDEEEEWDFTDRSSGSTSDSSLSSYTSSEMTEWESSKEPVIKMAIVGSYYNQGELKNFAKNTYSNEDSIQQLQMRPYMKEYIKFLLTSDEGRGKLVEYCRDYGSKQKLERYSPMGGQVNDVNEAEQSEIEKLIYKRNENGNLELKIGFEINGPLESTGRLDKFFVYNKMDDAALSDMCQSLLKGKISEDQILEYFEHTVENEPFSITLNPTKTMSGDISQLEFTPKQRVEVFYQAANGLACINEKGWMHGDIKLENFFVDIDEDGRLKVVVGDIDGLFCLKKKGSHGYQENQGTQPQNAASTEGYLPPEGAYIQDYDEMSDEYRKLYFGKRDVWALGVSMYRERTGELPPLSKLIHKPDMEKVIKDHEANKPVDTTSIIYIEWLALHPDHNQRPTMAEIRDRLNQKRGQT
jgi:serine/threonine protein kinase